MPSTPNPIAPLARTLSVLLAVFIGVQVFNLAFEAWTHYSLKLLMSGNWRFGWWDAIDDAVGWLGIVSLVVIYPLLYLVTTIMFLMWVYRVSRNLRAIPGCTLNHSPAWAVWSYIIPFVNIFVPPAVMGELWAVSHRSAAGSIVSLWWGLVVLSEVVARIVLKVLERSMRVGARETLTSDGLFLASIGHDLLAIAVTVVTATLVGRISGASARLFAGDSGAVPAEASGVAGEPSAPGASS